MSLTLEQYADWLDGRQDLLWPAAPSVERPKAQPHLKRLLGIRIVTFDVYGTLVATSGGELCLVHPDPFIMETALEKTIQEFKMWQAMTRKPGRPSAYMRRMYEQILDELHMDLGSSGERYPAIRSEAIWERLVKRLMKNEYRFDVGFYGSLNLFCEKISYFFHSSLQGTGPQPRALAALQALKQKGLALALWADGQCFTRVQLLRALGRQGKLGELAELFSPELELISFDIGMRKPSERLFEAMVQRISRRGVSPHEVLHVGSRLDRDIVPAKRRGFSTALFAGDKSSLSATNEQLNSNASRPDLLITELGQLVRVLG